MRIAVVSPHLPTPAMPMRGLSHDEQLQAFVEAGHDVRAVVPVAWSPRRWLAGTPIPAEERDGAVVVAHPHYPRLPRFLRGRSLERRLFARAAAAVLGTGPASPEVVLAHSASLPGGLIGHVGRAIFVVALWDHELYDIAPHSATVRESIARTLRAADCVIYVSEALRRHGISVAGAHRSVLIPTGIKTYPDLSVVWPEHFTVCTVTRLVSRKRVDRLIHAFARLVSDRPDARLVIVGEGPERPALVRLVRGLGIEGLVELAGALDARAARERMSRSSVMALPSVRESLAGVYFEAMSLGVPVVGTRGEGIEEHVDHGVSGILVPPDDDDALLAELRRLAVDPDRTRRIGEEGRRRFLAGSYTWRASAQAYLMLFEELLRDRGT
jgi:glycosyltransferase involved in cell wall biosynthesis